MSYEKENDRLTDYLGKAVETKLKSKGSKLTPEIIMHHVSAIHAVAKIRNGKASHHDLVGGQGAMDFIDTDYPLEQTVARHAQTCMEQPGNEEDINKRLNLVQGIPNDDRMTTAQAMKQMKDRLTTPSKSNSY